MYKYKFTVFTPTYNRGNTLHRVFESLVFQSFDDFEWLIIDDGSSDDTAAVVSDFAKVASFPVRYYYQPNSHKFKTILKAADLAEGELFYIVDSDDEILPDALKILYMHWEGIPLANRQHYSGVTGLCVDQHEVLVGSKYPLDVFDSDTLESSVRYRIKGEKSGFQRTDLMRKFNFENEYFNNGYIPEGIFWISFSKWGYKTRYVNVIIRRYYVNAGESIMTTAKFIPNAFGTYQFTLLFLNCFRLYFFKNLRLTIGQIRNYTVAGWVLGNSTLNLIKNLKYLIIKILFIATLPLSIIHLKNVYKR